MNLPICVSRTVVGATATFIMPAFDMKATCMAEYEFGHAYTIYKGLATCIETALVIPWY